MKKVHVSFRSSWKGRECGDGGTGKIVVGKPGEGKMEKWKS